MDPILKDETVAQDLFKRFLIGLVFSSSVLYVHAFYFPQDNYSALHLGGLYYFVYATAMGFLFALVGSALSMFHKKKLFVLAYTSAGLLIYLVSYKY